MLIIIFVIFAVTVAALVATAAKGRGRNPFVWFAASLLPGPFLAVALGAAWIGLMFLGVMERLTSTPEIVSVLHQLLGLGAVLFVVTPVAAAAFLFAMPKVDVAPPA
ncbi:MAG: hypothetical protein WD928_05230 [Gammaproteobacteria bacterium]